LSAANPPRAADPSKAANPSRAALPRRRLRLIAAFGLAVAVAGCSVAPAQPSAQCRAAPIDISYQTRVLQVLRVYTGADGVSHAEDQAQPAEESTYLGALLRQYHFGDPSNVVIVSGPPNFKLPRHAAPYREVFILLSGSSVMELSDGTSHRLSPGSVALVEDVTGPGHGGSFGPCGYVAVDMQFKISPAAAR
jgi:quercetin dioxygenase-like cupin family protein